MKYYNITTRFKDGTAGWKDEAPFDGIIVTAGAPVIPAVLLEQLTMGGRLVIPVGDENVQSLLRIIRTEEGFVKEDLGLCRFVKLIGEHGWSE
jgi:protein-L-isoaspartate(D-aspartate) O-methyltransferase